MPKKIQIFNGRGQYRRYAHIEKGQPSKCEHVYIGAESKVDAVRVMQEAGFHFTLSELNVYFCKDCWGDNMKGIEPQRGVWVTWKQLGPVERVL